MNVVGVDLSLTSTGLTATEFSNIVAMCNVQSKGKKSDTLEQRQQRLYQVANDVLDFVDESRADLVVIESPSYGSRFGSPHDRSGLWWQVVTALINDGYPVAQVSPQGRAKYGSGAGNSKKDVVFAHVIERYSDYCPFRIKNDDLADSLILAAMGARHLGYPVEAVDPPDDNLAAMSGVLWPSVQ